MLTFIDTQMVSDLLDLSKMEANRMQLEQKPFDVRECIEQMVDIFSGMHSHELPLSLSECASALRLTPPTHSFRHLWLHLAD